MQNLGEGRVANGVNYGQLENREWEVPDFLLEIDF